MIELAQHIERLLLENDCVIVPEFGGFVAHYTSASRVKEEHLFLPPARIIGFNPQLKLNDGVLVQSYMAAHETSFSDATRMVEKQVGQLVETLHEEGKVLLGNIGEIHYNIYGKYEFVPYDSKITTPALYGLASFEMRELAVLTQKEPKVLVAQSLPREKKTYDIRINRAFLRNAVAAVAAIILFFAFSTPVENTDVRKNNYAQLLPGELFEQIEKQSVAVTPVHFVHSSVQQQKKQSAASQTGKKQKATAQKPKVQIARPIAVKEVKVLQSKTEAATPVQPRVAAPSQKAVQPKASSSAADVQKKSKHHFHIIVAGGISLKDAKGIARKLQTEGHAGAQALDTDGKVRVSICSFNSRTEATQYLMELRKQENYKNAWLLAK